MSVISNTIRRRWWIIIICPVLALAAATLLVGPDEQGFAADVTLFVPSGAGTDGPGSANEAGRLAQQYTRLIPADSRIVQVVASATGTTAGDVRSRLDLIAVRDSSLIRATYTSDDPAEALAALDALVGAVVGADGGQTSIPSGFLQVVDADTTAESVETGSATLFAAALLAGLVVGVGGAFALERTDVRVDHVDLAVRRTRVPGSDLDDMPDPSVAVLLRHWCDSGTGPRVALLGSEPGRLATTTAVAERLRDISTSAQKKTPDWVQMDLRPGGSPGSAEGGEWLAADASVIVLVIPKGSQLRRVAHAVDALRKLDLGPTWLIVTGTSSTTSSTRTTVPSSGRSPRPERPRRVNDAAAAT